MIPPLYNIRSEKVTEALALLKQERRAFWWKLLGAGLSWSVALVTLFMALNRMARGALNSLPLLLLSLIGFLVGMAILWITNSRALSELMQSQDVRLVGPLIDALYFGYAGERRTLVTLLTRLLPRLKASDAPLLSPAQRNRLTQELELGDLYRETDYYKAILMALGQIGEENAVPIVERLAQGGPEAWPALMQRRSETWQEQRVREAAWECLSMLNLRLEMQRVSHTLLRPATISDTELLRPSEEAKHDPSQLLRSTSEEAEETDNPVWKEGVE